MANEFTARNGLIAQKDSVVTGSLIVTSGITGSLLGTASYAAQALSSSYASAYAAVFPYVGNATITGSIPLSGSISINNGTDLMKISRNSGALGRLVFSRPGNEAVESVTFGGGNEEIYIRSGAGKITHSGPEFQINNSAGSTGLGLFASTGDVNLYGNSSTNAVRVFGGTRNVLIQNGGTFTDAGYRLDVKGSTRLFGDASVSGSLAVNYPGLASIYKLGVGGSAVINGQIIVQDDSGIFAAYSSDGLTQTGGFNFNRYVGVNIYSSNANPIKFLVSGSELARINTTNVTLGSTNQNLVFTPTAGNPTLIQTGTTSSIAKVQSGTRALQLVSYAADINYLQAEGARLRIVTAGANGISFQTNGVLAGSISSNQNWTLGGEPDVGYRLDVSGSTRLNGNTNITGSAIISGSLEVPQVSGLNTSGGSLVILSTNNATKGTIDIGNNNAESVYFVNRQFQFTNVVLNAASNANGFLITRVTPTDTTPNYVTNRADQTTGVGGTINTISLITSGSTRLKASSAGNILIGTTTDAGYKLDVVGTSRFNGNMNITGSQTSLYFNYISNPNAVATAAAKVQLVNAAGNSSVVSIASDSDSTDPSLLTIGGSNKGLELTSNSVRAFRIFDATRNVIIQNGGTFTDAGYRLDVQGTTRFNGNSTITGSLNVTGSISQNGGALALQDGTILYYSIKWFTPSSTVSTSGTTVTSVGTQFLSTMVGSKLTISGESRIITAFTSTTQVTVDSAYSINYSGIAAGSWGVYSKGLELAAANGIPTVYSGFQNGGAPAGSIVFTYSAGYITNDFGYKLNNNRAAFIYNLQGSNDYSINWSSTNNYTGTGDLGLRRNAAGVLEVYNAVNGDGSLTNRRDLLARNITGSRVYVSSSNGTVSGSSLIVYGSGSSLPVFSVQGSQGELFSVTDSLSGSLFSVNDISGLPVLEAFSDNTVLLGSYQAPALLTTNKVVLTASGNFTLSSLPTSSYDGAFYDYTARSGSNARAGTIMAMWSGTAVNFTETTTLDFGSTTGLSLGVFVSGANMVLTGSASTTAWTIKTIIRSI